MDLFESLEIVLWHTIAAGGGGLGQEEGVVRVAGGVLLWLEQRVEVPERRLHVVVRRHLLEPHLSEDLAELCAHFKKRVQVATGGWQSQRLHGTFDSVMDHH